MEKSTEGLVIVVRVECVEMAALQKAQGFEATVTGTVEQQHKKVWFSK